jgi:autoinducer 2-degrading protein
VARATGQLKGPPNAAASVKEPGCRQFDVLFENSDPHHVFLYEVYDDETALEAHRATAHFKRFRETTAPMIAKRVARHVSPIASTSESGEAAMKTGLLAAFLLLVTVPAAAPQRSWRTNRIRGCRSMRVRGIGRAR